MGTFYGPLLLPNETLIFKNGNKIFNQPQNHHTHLKMHFKLQSMDLSGCVYSAVSTFGVYPTRKPCKCVGQDIKTQEIQ